MALEQLNERLSAAHRWRLLMARAERGAGLWWLLGALAAAAVVADLMFQFPAVLLIAADALWLATAAVLAARLALSPAVRRFDPQAEAVRLESGSSVRNNTLINAVQFDRMMSSAGASVLAASPALMQLEIASAETAANDLDPTAGLSRQRLARQLRLAAAISLLWLLAGATVPNVLRAVLVRFADPAGDHPPFCLTNFDIAVQPESRRVLFGQSAVVEVTLSGKRPDSPVRLVLDSPQSLTMPMFQTAPNVWRQRIENVRADVVFHAAIDGGRSMRQRIVMVPTPQIEQAEIRFQPPAYTVWPGRVEPLGDGGRIAALAGTEVTLRIRSNRPLSGGRIALVFGDNIAKPTSGTTTAPDTAAIEMEAESPGSNWAAGRFTLDRDGKFVATVTDAPTRPETRGTDSQQALTAYFSAIPDQPPAIRIDLPNKTVLVPPDAVIPVQIAASDDVCVDSVTLHKSFNGWPHQSQLLETQPNKAAQVQARPELDLKKLGVTAGDAIEVYATAVDNHPGKPGMADSEVYTFRVVSQEDLDRMMRARFDGENMRRTYQAALNEITDLAEQARKLEKEIEELKKQLASAPPDRDLTPEEQAALDKLRQKIEQYQKLKAQAADALRKMAKNRPLYDVQKDLARELEKLAKRLEQTDRDEMDRMLAELAKRKKPGEAAADLDQLMMAMGGDLGQFSFAEGEEAKTIGKSVQLTADAYKLLDAAQRFVELARRQQDLSRRMARWANKEELSEAEKLQADQWAAEQVQIAKELGQVTETLDTLGRKVEKDFPRMGGSAQKIAAKIRELGIRADMEGAARLLMIGSGRYGSALSARAYEKMKQLLESCMAASGSGMMEADQAIRLGTGMSLGQTLQQMAAAAGGTGSGSSGESASSWLDTGVWGMEQQQSADSDPDPRNPSATGRSTPGKNPLNRPADHVELIAGKADQPAAAAAGGQSSVPAQFRPLVEAYFRRLADESK